MSRLSPLSSPLLLGFDEIERVLDRVTKSTTDGYPPYNIERLPKEDSAPERLRITLAVAGFKREQIDIMLEENQLIIHGRQSEETEERHYLHRGIAARQFQRTFLLVEGMEVMGAELAHGLLSVDLVRPEPQRIQRRIEIASKD
jgi:HSP20 family molecular chaperone IbpA